MIDPAVDDRPLGIVLDQGGDTAQFVAMLAGRVRAVDIVDGTPVVAGLAEALVQATAGWVLTVPTAAVGLRADDLDDLIARAGRRGVIASDGVRDVPGLGLWPASARVEVSLAAREGTGLTLVTAGMGRVVLPLRVFGLDPDVPTPGR